MNQIIKIGLFSIALSLSVNSFAQEEIETGKSNTEFTIGISNIFSPRQTYNYYYNDIDYMVNEFLNHQSRGLVTGFKFHGTNGAFRLLTEAQFNSYTFEDEKSSSGEIKSRDLTTGLHMGYEFHSSWERVTVLYGFDAIFA